MSKIVISNIRLPEEEWIILKAAAAGRGMSVNQYLIYLTQVESLRTMLGVPKEKAVEEKGYEALRALVGLISKSKDKGMGASDEDKIIYDIK